MMSRLSEIKPLREYLGDKKDMIEQMFLCIEENQLKKMIPDVLKEATLEDIKAECLVELLGMSKKRILGILEGKELDESSEDSLELSDISEDETPIRNFKKEKKSPERNKKKKDKESKSSKSSKKTHKQPSSESDDILEVEEEEKETPPPPKRKKIKKKTEESPPEEISSTKTAKSSKKKQTDNINKSKKDTEGDIDIAVEVEPEKKEGGKNLLEILELEMRARAIRSLINREEKNNKGENDEEPSTSDKGKREPEVEEDDNDPDAVIVIDENIALEIDLTKDDSNSETEETNKVKEKLVPNYRKHNEDIDSENDAVDSDKALGKERGKNMNEKDSDDKTKNKNNTNSGCKASEEFIPRNWTERWLESNDVQKVMKTSKVLTNLKKRLINVSKQKPQEEKPSEEVRDNKSIEGTVKEYSQLQSIKLNNKINEEGESNRETTATRNDNEVNPVSTGQSNISDIVDNFTSTHLIGQSATTSESLELDDKDVNSQINRVTVDISGKSQEKAVVIVASPMLYNEVISDKEPRAKEISNNSTTCTTLAPDDQILIDNEEIQVYEGSNDNLSSKDESFGCDGSDEVDPLRIQDHRVNIQNEEVEYEANLTYESEDVLIISEECEIEDKEEVTIDTHITNKTCDLSNEVNRETKNLETAGKSGVKDSSLNSRTTPRCLHVTNIKEKSTSSNTVEKKQNDEKISQKYNIDEQNQGSEASYDTASTDKLDEPNPSERTSNQDGQTVKRNLQKKGKTKIK